MGRFVAKVAAGLHTGAGRPLCSPSWEPWNRPECGGGATYRSISLVCLNESFAQQLGLASVATSNGRVKRLAPSGVDDPVRVLNRRARRVELPSCGDQRHRLKEPVASCRVRIADLALQSLPLGLGHERPHRSRRWHLAGKFAGCRPNLCVRVRYSALVMLSSTLAHRPCAVHDKSSSGQGSARACGAGAFSGDLRQSTRGPKRPILSRASKGRGIETELWA
jgi:hypothetical protein